MPQAARNQPLARLRPIHIIPEFTPCILNGNGGTMGSGSSTYLSMYITIGYSIASAVIGAFVARAKNDFAGRGAVISLFSGIFGVISMAMTSPSKAREGDKSTWPNRGPEMTILNIIVLFLFNHYV